MYNEEQYEEEIRKEKAAVSLKEKVLHLEKRLRRLEGVTEAEVVQPETRAEFKVLMKVITYLKGTTKGVISFRTWADWEECNRKKIMIEFCSALLKEIDEWLEEEKILINQGGE